MFISSFSKCVGESNVICSSNPDLAVFYFVVNFVREVHLGKQICFLVINNHYWKTPCTFENMVLEGKENEDKFLIFKLRELYHFYTNKLNIRTSNLIYNFISFINKIKLEDIYLK